MFGCHFEPLKMRWDSNCYWYKPLGAISLIKRPDATAAMQLSNLGLRGGGQNQGIVVACMDVYSLALYQDTVGMMWPFTCTLVDLNLHKIAVVSLYWYHMVDFCMSISVKEIAQFIQKVSLNTWQCFIGMNLYEIAPCYMVRKLVNHRTMTYCNYIRFRVFRQLFRSV